MTKEVPGEVAVGVVDQPVRCAGCNYDLRGVLLCREPHYGLLISRCPECSRVTPLDDAAKPAQRIAGLGVRRALVWWILSGLLLIGTGATLGGIVQSAGYVASARYAEELAKQTRSAGQDLRWDGVSRGLYSRIDTRVIDAGYPERIMKSMGGWRGATDFVGLQDLLWLFPACALWAVVWHTFFSHISRRRLRILGAMTGLITGSTLAIYYASSNRTWGYEWAISVAEARIGMPIAAVSVVVAFAMFDVALLRSRPLAWYLLSAFAPESVQQRLRPQFAKFDDGKRVDDGQKQSSRRE